MIDLSAKYRPLVQAEITKATTQFRETAKQMYRRGDWSVVSAGALELAFEKRCEFIVNKVCGPDKDGLSVTVNSPFYGWTPHYEELKEALLSKAVDDDGDDAEFENDSVKISSDEDGVSIDVKPTSGKRIVQHELVIRTEPLKVEPIKLDINVNQDAASSTPKRTDFVYDDKTGRVKSKVEYPAGSGAPDVEVERVEKLIRPTAVAGGGYIVNLGGGDQ